MNILFLWSIILMYCHWLNHFTYESYLLIYLLSTSFTLWQSMTLKDTRQELPAGYLASVIVYSFLLSSLRLSYFAFIRCQYFEDGATSQRCPQLSSPISLSSLPSFKIQNDNACKANFSYLFRRTYSVAHPQSPKTGGGRQPLRLGQTYNLARFCWKLHENEGFWTGGGASLVPLVSANDDIK